MLNKTLGKQGMLQKKKKHRLLKCLWQLSKGLEKHWGCWKMWPVGDSLVTHGRPVGQVLEKHWWRFSFNPLNGKALMGILAWEVAFSCQVNCIIFMAISMYQQLMKIFLNLLVSLAWQLNRPLSHCVKIRDFERQTLHPVCSNRRKILPLLRQKWPMCNESFLKFASSLG